MKIFAHIVSVVLHPLLMPTFTYLILFQLAPSVLPAVGDEGKLQLALLIFLLSFLIPLASIFFLFVLDKIFNARKKMIMSNGEEAMAEQKNESVFMRSMALESREDRILPFTITTLLYGFVSYVLLFKTPATFTLLGVVFASTTLCLALVTLITRFWKISAHSTGIAGVAGFFLAIYLKTDEANLFYAFMVSLLLAGLLMTCRLYLNLHTLAQVSAGALLGFIISLITMLYFV
ncbi:MAG: phosphatase PAP2 family protein [Verrucomicrobia bacterium]|nr:phosphatase PAP2 family protein [Cytophagales bacterium]